MQTVAQADMEPAREPDTAPPSSEEDNMDDDSDFDEDSRSGAGSSSRDRDLSQRRKSKGEAQRNHHNVLERKRRDLIKDSFSKLKDVVPSLAQSGRASRAQILKRAADYIQTTHMKNEATRADLEEIIKKNKELEDQLGEEKLRAFNAHTVIKSERKD